MGVAGGAGPGGGGGGGRLHYPAARGRGEIPLNGDSERGEETASETRAPDSERERTRRAWESLRVRVTVTADSEAAPPPPASRYKGDSETRE